MPCRSGCKGTMGAARGHSYHPEVSGRRGIHGRAAHSGDRAYGGRADAADGTAHHGCGSAEPGSGEGHLAGRGGETGILGRLRADLDDAMCGMGFERETRRFHPHVTLARARRNAVRLPAGLTGAVEAAHLTVDRLALYSSDLRPGGAVYNVLGHADLSGSRKPRGSGP